MDFMIDIEAAADLAAREALLDACFGPGRRRKSSEAIRRGRLPAEGLALVARAGGRLVGTLRLWHAAAADDRPLLLLGPLAVAADARGAGIGAALVQAALKRARLDGHGAVVLVGDEPYYRRFGFSAATAAGLAMPGPFERHRLLGLELQPGALSGARGRISGTGPVAAPSGRRRVA